LVNFALPKLLFGRPDNAQAPTPSKTFVVEAAPQLTQPDFDRRKPRAKSIAHKLPNNSSTPETAFTLLTVYRWLKRFKEILASPLLVCTFIDYLMLESMSYHAQDFQRRRKHMLERRGRNRQSNETKSRNILPQNSSERLFIHFTFGKTFHYERSGPCQDARTRNGYFLQAYLAKSVRPNSKA
jgi:hypothetical protein